MTDMGPPYARADTASAATMWNGIGGTGGIGGALDFGMLPVHHSGNGIARNGMTDSSRNSGLVDLWSAGAPSMFYCGGNGGSMDGNLSPTAALSQVYA